MAEAKSYRTVKKAPFYKKTGALYQGYFSKYDVTRAEDNEYIEWKEATTFFKELQFLEIKRNGEALPSVIFNEVGTENILEMHLSDFEDLMNCNDIPIYPGKVWHCDWRVIKKYGRFWIAHIPPQKENK